MEMENSEKPVQPVARSNPMRKAIILPDVLLVIQFLLGMYNTFYVTFPENASALDNWKFVLRSVSEMAHIVMAVVLAATVLINFVRAVRMKSRHMKNVGIIGFIALGLAILGGVGFVTTQNDLYSYLMAIGFLAAILNVNIGLLTFVPPRA